MSLCPAMMARLILLPLDEQDVKSSIITDLCCRDVNFATPCRLLVDARLPIVDHTIQLFTVKSLESEQVDEITQDPLTVDRVPTVSVIRELKHQAIL